MIASLEGAHPGGFTANVNSRFEDINCPSYSDSSVLLNVIWVAKKPMRLGSR